MKTRIITGVLCGVLMLVVLLLPWTAALSAFLSLICVIAVHEIFATEQLERYMVMKSSAFLLAAVAPFFALIGDKSLILGCYTLFAIILAGVQLKNHATLSVDKTGMAFFMTVLSCTSISCISYMRTVDRHGLFYVFLALIVVWMNDTGAYFFGSFFGKHKMCPTISPKKTVEGLIGGIGVSILSALITAGVYQWVFLKDGATVSFWRIAVVAVICAPLSVLGDLFASVIKRQKKIKDFGTIMPGHGGVLDRFDSMLFVLPLLYLIVAYFKNFPLVY